MNITIKCVGDISTEVKDLLRLAVERPDVAARLTYEFGLDTDDGLSDLINIVSLKDKDKIRVRVTLTPRALRFLESL